MRNYKNILSIALKNQKKQFIALLLITAISIIIDYIFILSSYPFLHYMSSAENLAPTQNIFKYFQDISELNISEKDFWIWTWLSFAILSVLTKFTYIWMRTYTSNMFGFHISNKLISGYGGLTYESAKNFNENSVTSAIAAKVNILIKGTIQPIFNIIQAVISFAVLTLTLIFTNEYQLLLIITSILIFYLVMAGVLKNSLANLSELVNRSQTEQLELLSAVQRGFKDLYINNAMPNVIDQYTTNEKKLRKNLTQVHVISEAPRYLLELFVFTVISVLLIYYSINGSTNFDTVYIGVVIVGFARVVPVFQLGFMGFAHAKGSIATLNEFEKIFQDIESSSKSILVSASQNLEFEELEIKIFHHSDGIGRPAFRNLELKIRVGEKVAITGPSGCGKSSFLELMCGLNTIKSGYICFVHETGRNMVIDLRGHVALVPQEVYVSDQTVKESLIAYSGREISEKQMYNALRHAQLINSDSEIAFRNFLEKNAKSLSGGERQRLAFARALLQQKSTILIDEGTTGLDKKTKNSLLDRIFADDKLTLVCVTHDRDILHRFDRVLSLEDGKLVDALER